MCCVSGTGDLLAPVSVENTETCHAQEKRGNAALASLNPLFLTGVRSRPPSTPSTLSWSIDGWCGCLSHFPTFSTLSFCGNREVDRCGPYFTLTPSDGLAATVRRTSSPQQVSSTARHGTALPFYYLQVPAFTISRCISDYHLLDWYSF